MGPFIITTYVFDLKPEWVDLDMKMYIQTGSWGSGQTHEVAEADTVPFELSISTKI